MKCPRLTDDFCRSLVARRMLALGYGDDGFTMDAGGGGGVDTPTSGFYDQPAGPPSPAGDSIVNDSGSGFWSGFGDFFNVGVQAFTNIERTLNPPKTGGQLVWNPATQTYQAASAMTGRPVNSLMANPMVLLAGVVIIVLLLRK